MPAEEDLAYSRTVKALAGQYVEIPFRGPGWVYLGEFGSRRGVSYDARRMEEDGMTFIFRADQEGSYSLKFNRQDFIRDSVLNDYVKVIVESPPQSTGAAWSRSQAVPDRVYAGPRWPPSTGPGGVPGDPVTAQAGPLEEENAPEASAAFSGPPPAAGAAAAESAAGSAVPAAGDAPAPPPSGPVERGETAAASGGSPAGATVSPGDLLRRAKADYDGGRVAAALSALDQYLLSNPAGGDEAYWLYGQALEANNPATRDIRRALEYYRRLMREYPQSGRYEDARRRAAYLERYYFNIQ
jgi:tetratricopeptide (TPR) repeat protein